MRKRDVGLDPAQVQETVARDVKHRLERQPRVHQARTDLHVNARRLEKLLSHASPELGRFVPPGFIPPRSNRTRRRASAVAVHAGRRSPRMASRASPPGRSSPVRAARARAHADEIDAPTRSPAAD